MTTEEGLLDIPRIRKLLEHFEGMAEVFESPEGVAQISLQMSEAGLSLNLKEQAEQLRREVEAFELVSRHFNRLLSPRGWIVYESIPLQAAAKATCLAIDGKFEEADSELVDQYSGEYVGIMLTRMLAVWSIKPRMPLLEKALVDYIECRYYSCVLVLLSQMDGLVVDIAPNGKGFFKKSTRVVAADSEAGHVTGISALNNVMRVERNQTAADALDLPFRHGIMHGRDLNYDNKVVAAKCWAALFALRDWAVRAQRGEAE